MKRTVFAVLALVLVGATTSAAHADIGVGDGGVTPGTSRNFTLIGHNPLGSRGMNAAITIYDHYLYVGNRTDGSSRCGVGDPRRDTTGLDSCPHPDPGVLVVDIADPAQPTTVGQFGPEFTTGSNVGQTSRELRVWPQQGLLMVMYFRCSSVIHVCPPSSDVWSIRFFDLWANPINPPLVATYTPSRKPHEMFLWQDPRDASRALLWLSTPTSSANPAVANMLITDISGAREGRFVEIAKGNWNQFYPGSSNPANYDFDLALHSMAVSPDGTRTYLAQLRGHFLVLDTSDVAMGNVPAGEVLSLNDKLLTPVDDRPRWGTSDGACARACAESHSAVPVPGRPFVLTTDEVYGKFTVPSFGCPWGWARLIQVAQPKHPKIVGEYRTPANEESFCGSAADDPTTEQFTSYSSHNPTLTRDLAVIAWHSAGLQIIDIADPAEPAQAGWYSPTPLPSVANEDPALSRGPNKVVIWSYPIINNGLVYILDIRNGLYILRYTGPAASEVAQVRFLEGNSNLGDAAQLDKSAP